LPNPETPNDVEQTEYVLKNHQIDKNTAIFGHSFGGVVALRLLEKGIKPGQVVLAATPFSGKFLDNKERPTVSEALKKGFDFKTITKNCKNFVALYDTSDYVVPMSDGQSFADQLKIQLLKVKSEKPHFNGEKEPNVFTALVPEVKGEIKDTEKVERELNKLIKKVTGDIENFSFNTSISAFMEFHNAIKDDFITLESVKKFLTVLYPFAPHISEELGQLVSKSVGKWVSKTLQAETWPSFDASLIIDKEVEMVVQINGKVRGKIKVPSGSLEDYVKTEVQKLEPVKQSLVGESIKRVIFVKDRLINLVI
jgi:predicted alpha/beta hydrolase family esterase